MTQKARDWLSEGIREKQIPEDIAVAIMRIIENPAYISLLEKEVEMLKAQITKKLR